jgi:DNA-directed RNA polymerase specialized sigma24 family protein
MGKMMKPFSVQGTSDSPCLVDAQLRATALGADQHVWDELVERFADLVWSVARRHLRSGHAAAQVCAVTWRRLGDHIHALPPEAVPGWLRQTAERESSRLLALSHT